MPKVRVPRKNVTADEVVTVLSRRLGPRYQVESNGGGFVLLRLVNTFSTARQVADALRRSPEFRSL